MRESRITLLLTICIGSSQLIFTARTKRGLCYGNPVCLQYYNYVLKVKKEIPYRIQTFVQSALCLLESQKYYTV